MRSSGNRASLSASLFRASESLFPGGVHSPVRAFRHVERLPLYLVKGKGPYVYDVTGRRYLDYLLAFGPLILGHAHPAQVRAARLAAAKGFHFGAVHPLEIRVARLLRQAFPSLERMRFVVSGTEAVMSALRLARAATGREAIVKFEGAYHGHSDFLLAQAGSGLASAGLPASPGVPKEAARKTFVVPFNDLPALKRLFQRRPGQVAAVIIEPVCGNMGLVLPEEGFLRGVARLCHEAGALLVFDEVITGFRACFGGVQTMEGIWPDLTILGKIVGGGTPFAVFGGKKKIMAMLAPQGPVYQAGTLSASPLSLAVAEATLRDLSRREAAYGKQAQLVRAFATEAAAEGRRAGVPITVNAFGLSFSLFFSEGPVRNFADVQRSRTDLYPALFRSLLDRGIYFPPSPFETAFVSFAHDSSHLDRTLLALRKALRDLSSLTCLRKRRGRQA